MSTETERVTLLGMKHIPVVRVVLFVGMACLVGHVKGGLIRHVLEQTTEHRINLDKRNIIRSRNRKIYNPSKYTVPIEWLVG